MAEGDSGQMVAPPNGIRVTETGAGVSRESCMMAVNAVVTEVC